MREYPHTKGFADLPDHDRQTAMDRCYDMGANSYRSGKECLPSALSLSEPGAWVEGWWDAKRREEAPE